MSDEIALEGGRWVQRGLIRVWTGPRPIDRPDLGEIRGECRGCGRQLVTSRRWMKLDIDYRQSISETHARRSVGGLCNQCYIREKRGGQPRSYSPCGTAAGYSRHRRRKEPPCQPCYEAIRVYKRQQRAALKNQQIGA